MFSEWSGPFASADSSYLPKAASRCASFNQARTSASAEELALGAQAMHTSLIVAILARTASASAVQLPPIVRTSG